MNQARVFFSLRRYALEVLKLLGTFFPSWGLIKNTDLNYRKIDEKLMKKLH